MRTRKARLHLVAGIPKESREDFEAAGQIVGGVLLLCVMGLLVSTLWTRLGVTGYLLEPFARTALALERLPLDYVRH